MPCGAAGRRRVRVSSIPRVAIHPLRMTILERSLTGGGQGGGNPHSLGCGPAQGDVAGPGR
jgi:hypothetical protein